MKGLTFPFTLNSKGGIDYSVSTESLVRTNLKTILAWEQGTRFFLPEFGTRIHQLLENEPNDQVLQAMIPEILLKPLQAFEPRIKIVDFKVEAKTEEKIQVYISYLIIETNTLNSFSFPFYTNVTQ